ncbi:TetR/AcrR family transcriptional regulator [Neisseria sp. ZJ106]|uniref:TetR/AcrR family transcriptional regulator n=1 Tax=Neisseria lisongii TaxID=2912188 RepID=A0ABY7RKL4_9NEIS|nr:TetR/AcrR family transcriptional regulator [Neisseria lisongii]MCF7522106.1 TetR/AcrR family transcriptional regulator [Neisseria lisongii]WCL71952.1 TetR/AcrR family transcriptional regulator [Neisseria lisongii]
MKPHTAPDKIWHAFLTLLAGHSPDDISVQQICDVAQVHRSSFYRYFRDLYTLADYGFRQVAEQTMMSATDARSTLLSTRKFIDFVDSRRHELCHLLTARYANRFQQAIYQPLERHMLSVFAMAGDSYIHPAPPEYVARYHIGGLARIISIWLQTPNARKAELIMQIDVLARYMMKDCMKKM